jgi:hypothetical protein
MLDLKILKIYLPSLIHICVLLAIACFNKWVYNIMIEELSKKVRKLSEQNKCLLIKLEEAELANKKFDHELIQLYRLADDLVILKKKYLNFVKILLSLVKSKEERIFTNGTLLKFLIKYLTICELDNLLKTFKYTKEFENEFEVFFDDFKKSES